MIDRERAIELARQVAVERGWAFAEPLEVLQRKGWFGRPGRFEIETNAGSKGTKARFVIDADSGAVLSAGYIPR